jgi:hypothetical protein
MGGTTSRKPKNKFSAFCKIVWKVFDSLAGAMTNHLAVPAPHPRSNRDTQSDASSQERLRAGPPAVMNSLGRVCRIKMTISAASLSKP